jgi:hypothetical protein
MKIPYRKLLLGPTTAYALGAFCNLLVLAVNNGQMPVLWPGGCSKMVVSDDDIVHVCMTSSSHLKFLSDIAVFHDVGVFSIGDGLLYLGNLLLWPCLILWAGFIIKDYSEKK